MALSGPSCKLLRREPVEARMRSVIVIVVTPARDDLAGMAVAPEQMLVQTFIPQPAVERFNEAVLHRFTRGDVVSLDAARLLPLKNGVRRQLGAVVRDHHAEITPDAGDPVEFPRNTDARDRVVRHRRQALPVEVVDHAKDPEPPAIVQGARDEVQRPALVAILRDRHRRPCPQRPHTAASSTYREPFFLVEPLQLLVFHLYPFASQQNMQPAITEAATRRRQLPQAFADCFISRTSRRIALRLPVHRKHVRRCD